MRAAVVHAPSSPPVVEWTFQCRSRGLRGHRHDRNLGCATDIHAAHDWLVKPTLFRLYRVTRASASWRARWLHATEVKEGDRVASTGG